MELYSLAGSDANSERQDDANEGEGEESEGDALSSGQPARSNAGVEISIRGIILRDCPNMASRLLGGLTVLTSMLF